MNEYRLLLVVYTFLLISASNAGESINTAIPRDNVYGVLSQEVYRISSISNNRKSAKLNCVFFPTGSKYFYRRSEAKAVVDTLSDLKRLVLIGKNGNLLNSSFSKFELAANDYPQFFAGSSATGSSCGNLLVGADKTMITKQVTADIDRKSLDRKFGTVEKEMFVDALRNQSFNSILAKKSVKYFSKAFDKSRKSDLNLFSNGQNWYFSRSYVVEFFTNPPISTLIFYKMDSVNKAFTPEVVFLNAGVGENAVYRNFSGVVDLDRDGVFEVLVRDSTLEYSLFSFLQLNKENNTWQPMPNTQ